ncbi:PAS domain S-box protein [Halorubrum sp. PV6]|uniref:hybrid sensor histidine kinase/response regulator n=1 Tax=Halorubrum sp. PV6 TaxID=634157 RepID=UPI0011984AB5|nr:PAS domain S-box protein [Halorubrum sp. PV6]AZQ16078.1 two-component system sensor histidine kinase/response regulator [Halorubrum sp. PV6]
MSMASVTIRVLHVDDDRDFADLTATLLKRVDDCFSVDTAPNADAALDKLADSQFDCVVSDYDMPGENGLNLLGAVRDQYSDLPFILFTGKGSEEVASEAISAGVTDYLQKEPGTEQYTVLANRIRNVVDRSRAQAEQQRQLDAIETAREGISILNENRRFVYVNQAYADIYGYSSDELIGKSWELLYRDEDREKIRTKILPTVESEGYWSGETIGLRADRETFIEDHALALTDSDELICTVRDATTETEQEQELEEAQARLEALFEYSPDMITIHDADGIIRDVNRRFCEELDYNQAEIIGEGVWTVDPSIDQEDLRAQLAATETGERFRVGTEFQRQDGLTVPVEVHVVRLDLADSDRFVALSRDITSQKEREQRLQALHGTMYELLAAESREEIAEIGVEAAREIIGLDANVCNLYDADRDVLVPVSSTSEVDDLIGSPPTFPHGDGIAWRAFEQGEAQAIDDIRTDPDIFNPETLIRSELHLPLDDHGILIAGSPTVAAFDEEDLVLGKLLAKGIVVALDTFKQTQRLQEREAELTRQNEQLEQFASFVSHDLKNPLAVAEGYLELAREDCESDSLDTVAEAHGRMRTLINDILTLTRDIGSNADRSSVSLNNLCTECWDNIETKRATLDNHIAKPIQADRSQLKRLLINLFQNAVEHGGDDVTVTVGDLPDGFYVEDDGSGIPADEQADVFESGYSTTTDGTGLGLAIVNEVVESHNWNIHATEDSSGGARFEITDDQLGG